MDAMISTEDVAAALSGQKTLYAEILQLAKQQSQFVATGQSEELMGVLAARSRLIDRVARLDVTLQPYKGRWQELLDSLPAAKRETVAGLLREVQQMLGAILAQDEADKESLVKQKSEVGSELKRTVTGAALHRAYGMKPRVGGVLGSR
jgi:C4-dicarboxylate-specific signal transduction histidine kinase